GNAALEVDRDVGRSLGGEAGIDGPGVRGLGWLVPGIFEHARLDAAAPEVRVDGVRAVGRHRHWNVVLLGVADLLVAGHAPLADGRDDLQVRREGLDTDVEPHLVVALAGAAVRDVTGALLAGVVDQNLRDEWSRQGCGQRIHTLVQRASLQRRNRKVAHEGLAGVLDERLNRTRAERL